MIARKYPFIIGIWQPLLQDALQFACRWHLGERVIQVAKDAPRGYWLIFRTDEDERNMFRNLDVRPRLTIIPEWNDK
jgi:hypothetical protein